MNNIDKFHHCASVVLAYLYQNFPLEITLDVCHFAEYSHAENQEFFFATVEYLNNEGLLKYGHSQYGGYSNVILSSKALYVLNSPQDDEASDEKVGDLLLRAIEGKDSAQLAQLMHGILGKFSAS